MNINVAKASFSISRVIASNLRVNQQIAPQPSPARPSPAQPSPGGGRCHPNPISEEASKCNYELEARGASTLRLKFDSNMGNKCAKVNENGQQHSAHHSVNMPLHFAQAQEEEKRRCVRPPAARGWRLADPSIKAAALQRS